MNVLRALIYEDQVSLTIVDTTELVKVGLDRHGFKGEQADVFARTMSFLTYVSSCLKEETGEVSISLQTDGKLSTLSASGNTALAMRGYLAWDTEKTESIGDGALTLVRDDGYSRPFVGSCALVKGSLDQSFEEYYRISEQLPTEITTCFLENEGGRVAFCGVIALQPLPFASQTTLEKMPDEKQRLAILKEVARDGLFAVANRAFGVKEEDCHYKRAEYRCNCSREYLKGVLVSVGEKELRQIVKEDGAIRAHCHYCNTDYAFDEKDVDEMFQKE